MYKIFMSIEYLLNKKYSFYTKRIDEDPQAGYHASCVVEP